MKQLTISSICRYMIMLVSRNLESGFLQLARDFDNAAADGLMLRHVEFDAGDLNTTLEDYADYYLMPHAVALSTLLKMADAHEVYQLPLRKDQTGCRHMYDGISMRGLVVPNNMFRFEVLFRPRVKRTKILLGCPEIALPQYCLSDATSAPPIIGASNYSP